MGCDPERPILVAEQSRGLVSLSDVPKTFMHQRAAMKHVGIKQVVSVVATATVTVSIRENGSGVLAQHLRVRKGRENLSVGCAEYRYSLVKIWDRPAKLPIAKALKVCYYHIVLWRHST